MTSRAAPVVVGLDGSPPGDLALRWAIGHALAVGDVIYIPANTPHQMLVSGGKHLNAAVVKVEPK